DTIVFREKNVENASHSHLTPKPGFMESQLGHALLDLKSLLYKISQQSLIEPVPSSPLTRISWIKSVAKAQVQSSSDINYLSQFTPNLEAWLAKNRFPAIQKEIIDPLEAILQQIPNMRALDEALEITVVLDRYTKLRGVLTEVLGLSIFRGFRLRKDSLNKIIDSSGFPEAREVFLDRKLEVDALEKVIDKIEGRLKSTYDLVKTLVEEQNPIVFTLTKIRRDYLSPINTILSRLHNRALIAESLGLNNLTAQIVSCEKFMLQLWDENAIYPDIDGNINGDNYDVKHASNNPIINFFFCNSENVEFTLLDEIQKLENTMRQTHKRLNAIIFTLTFIDKLSVKVLSQVESCADTVNQILESDQQQAFNQDGAEVDQKKINFMDDNRLFFRSIPMQLKTIKSKINQLLRDPALSEPYNVELFRKLDNQVFKLQNFLKGSLDYIEGRRDGVGLSAALAQIHSNTDQPGLSDDAGTGNLPATPSKEQIKKLCAAITGLLEKISLIEWDMLKLPIPPQKGLAVMQQNKMLVDKAWLDVEGVSYDLEQLDAAGGTHAEEITALATLQGRAEKLLARLTTVHDQISKPFFADRRLEAEAEQTEGEKKEKRQAAKQPDLCRQSIPNSRRDKERVVVTSSISLQTVIGKNVINGKIADVSVNGICMKTKEIPIDLQADTQATFKFEKDKTGTTFSCRVVRVSGNMIILNITPDQESAFSKMVRTYIV
ncbi:MAG: PilZ domain-containing protein, partial [Magnetococcales bacterium]|nr:PilZ domain-containing protein [Magnetococcales bacterium]